MKDLGASVNLIVCQKSKVQDWVDHLAQYGYEDEFKMIYDCTKWDMKDWESFVKNPKLLAAPLKAEKISSVLAKNRGS